MNNLLEKSNDEMREKQNNLSIQKDLLENDIVNLRSCVESEKSASAILVNRINELEGFILT